MNLIFLDIDGVCNDKVAHPRTLYCRTKTSCVLRLDRILVETNARIVLTSSWRYLVHGGSMSMMGLKNLLHSHWIDGERLIGITRRDITDGTALQKTQPRTDRGQQITEWLAGNVWNPTYVVIDDMDLEISSEGHPFIQTDGNTGLTTKDMERAIVILRGEQ